jgi:hypothetical protein
MDSLRFVRITALVGQLLGMVLVFLGFLRILDGFVVDAFLLGMNGFIVNRIGFYLYEKVTLTILPDYLERDMV